MDSKFRQYKICCGALYGYKESELISEFQRPGVYGLILNEEKFLYIGEFSVSMFDRIAGHIGNLSARPVTRFGICPEDLKKGKLRVSVVVIENDKYADSKKREEKEKGYIEKYKPLIQTPYSDRCIPPEQRKIVIENFKEEENII